MAKGYTQKSGIDYGETFSPVVKHLTLTLICAISAKLNLNIFHLDVATAFLNRDLKENIFMMIPEALQLDQSDKVLKLKKAIYGLK